MIRARKAVFPIALAILIGCGGSGSVSDPAHLRFFDALNDTGDVRLYVGGHLYEAGGDASIENGQDPKYGDVPSGSGLSLVLNKYANQSSSGNSSSLATLTAQTFLAGRSYTAVALLSGTTKKLVVLSDNTSLDSDTAYFRIVNANNTTTPLYIQVIDKATDSELYESGTGGLASGGNTGLQSDYFGTSTAGEDVVIHVYSDSAFTDEIATQTVTYTPGKAFTTFVYNRSSGSGLSFKTSTDQGTNVTTTTTGTTGDTSGTTGDTTGTTATPTTGGTTATPTTGTTATGTTGTATTGTGTTGTTASGSTGTTATPTTGTTVGGTTSTTG